MNWPLGKFLSADGEEVLETEPAPDDAFPIRCGPWPNAHNHALQRICCACGEFVGISPKGWAYHQQLPSLRPLFCAGCFDLFVAMAKELS